MTDVKNFEKAEEPCDLKTWKCIINSLVGLSANIKNKFQSDIHLSLSIWLASFAEIRIFLPFV